MKTRKSTALVAGASTLCIAAASGTAAAQVQPQVELAAHHESTVRVVHRDYSLTASGNPLLDIASLPFQNYFTIASTLGNLAAFVPPVNQATGAFFQGQWDKIPPLLHKAITDEIAAIAAVIQLPATIIAYDLNVIAGAFGGAAVGNSVALSAVNSPAAATPADLANGLLAVLQLPFQNYFTIASTLGNLAAFVPPVNQATGAFFQGQWDKIPALLQKAFTDELAAINNVLQLPATLIKYNLEVIANAFGLGATALNANMSPIEAQALTAALSTDTTTDTAEAVADVTETDTDATETDADVTETDTTDADTADTADADTADADTADTDTAEADTADADTAEADTATADAEGADAKDADAKDADAKDADAKGADAKDTDKKDTDKKDTDKKDTDTSDKSGAGANSNAGAAAP